MMKVTYVCGYEYAAAAATQAENAFVATANLRISTQQRFSTFLLESNTSERSDSSQNPMVH